MRPMGDLARVSFLESLCEYQTYQYQHSDTINTFVEKEPITAWYRNIRIFQFPSIGNELTTF